MAGPGMPLVDTLPRHKLCTVNFCSASSFSVTLLQQKRGTISWGTKMLSLSLLRRRQCCLHRELFSQHDSDSPSQEVSCLLFLQPEKETCVARLLWQSPLWSTHMHRNLCSMSLHYEIACSHPRRKSSDCCLAWTGVFRNAS